MLSCTPGSRPGQGGIWGRERGTALGQWEGKAIKDTDTYGVGGKSRRRPERDLRMSEKPPGKASLPEPREHSTALRRRRRWALWKPGRWRHLAVGLFSILCWEEGSPLGHWGFSRECLDFTVTSVYIFQPGGSGKRANPQTCCLLCTLHIML